MTTLAIGHGVGGSARWVSIGPFDFQFSELAKILMIVVLANYLATRQGQLSSLVSILGACILVVPPWILVMIQPDLGTSLVLLAVLGGMLFMSGASLRWLGLLVGTALASFPFVWTYILRDYQKQRIVSFLDPASDMQGAGYQLYQSQIAVGSGGWFGKGLTNGTQNQLNFLPVQESDFVAAIYLEELGFLGAMLLIVLFGALLWRILVVRVAVARSVRNDVRQRARVDDPLPAHREPRDGHRDHADHRHSAAVHLARRCLADQPGRGPRHPPEREHQANPGGVVTRAALDGRFHRVRGRHRSPLPAPEQPSPLSRIRRR